MSYEIVEIHIDNKFYQNITCERMPKLGEIWKPFAEILFFRVERIITEDDPVIIHITPYCETSKKIYHVYNAGNSKDPANKKSVDSGK